MVLQMDVRVGRDGLMETYLISFCCRRQLVMKICLFNDDRGIGGYY